jgi:hypothetical protein
VRHQYWVAASGWVKTVFRDMAILMPRESLVVFISSPGDVRPERAAAERIVTRLARQFITNFEITSIRWERKPLRATADFQSQIPRASLAHIVVVILWSRLGSLLDENQYRGLISGKPVTGTEYEFEDALNGRDGTQPALFVYKKIGIPQFTDERQILEYPDQSARVNRFFETWIKRVAHHTFSDIVSFEELLSDHLSGEIRRRIQSPHPEAAVNWFQGSPLGFLVQTASRIPGVHQPALGYLSKPVVSCETAFRRDSTPDRYLIKVALRRFSKPPPSRTVATR